MDFHGDIQALPAETGEHVDEERSTIEGGDYHGNGGHVRKAAPENGNQRRILGKQGSDARNRATQRSSDRIAIVRGVFQKLPDLPWPFSGQDRARWE